MPMINQQELENLRHLIGAHDTGAQKLETYAQQCRDPKIKKLFQRPAGGARQTKQQLMQFLN